MENGGPRCFSCSSQPAQQDDDQPTSLWPNGFHTDNCNYYSGRDCVEQCQQGEVCQTLVNYDSDNEWGVYSKSCASKESCLALANSGKCKDRIDDPQCAYCCEDDYCNYNHSMKRLIAGGACAEPNPCYNDAACTQGPGGTPQCDCLPGTYGRLCEKTVCESGPCKNEGLCRWQKASPYYTCSCRAANSGAVCNEYRSLCEENLCANGGTCYNHGSDYRCNCTEGFVGTRCEIKRPLDCKIPSHHFVFPESHTQQQTHCSLYDSVVAERKDVYSKACVRYMSDRYRVGGTYKAGQDGDVEEVELAGLGRCERGSDTMFYQISVCCHACLSAPCQNGGYCLDVKDSEQGEFVCKCRHGYGGRFCENRLATCLAFGDVHYHTFDQTMSHFQGACKYTLAEPTTAAEIPSFQILAKNEHRYGNTEVSFTQYVELVYKGTTVRIGPGWKLYVNGVLSAPGHTYGGLSTSINGLFLRVETDFGLVVESNGDWLVSVFVPDEFMGAVQGLCGNFNGDPEDDLTTKPGVDVSEEEDGEWRFGTSYQVLDDDEPLCSGVTQTPKNCSVEEEEAKDKNFCGLLIDDEDNSDNPFTKCMRDEDINADLFFESCAYDFCHLDDKKGAACSNLHAFATRCQGFGYIINWRDYANCPAGCEGGSSYSPLATACAPTCENRKPTCTLDDTEACVCPEGQLLKDGVCIEPKECGCLDANNVRRSFGDRWLSVDCGTVFTCRICEGCATVDEITETPTGGCPGSQVCVATNQADEGICQHQKCVDDYGVEHEDGSQWTDDECDVWRCLSGETLKQQSGCPPKHQCMLLSSGQYGCRRDGCQDNNGKWYEVGDVWKSSDCLTQLKCVENGQIVSVDVEGCAEDEECVTPASPAAVYYCRKYTCTDGYGNVRRLGEYWNSYDCSMRYYCSKQGITEDDHRCPPNQVCVSGECRPVKPTWGPWSAWSACEADDCSPGRRGRDRVCYPVGSYCGEPSTEVERCTCTDQYVPSDCEFCKGNESGQGFLENKCDCTKYFHCVRYDKWTMYPMTCAPCTRWDQSKLTCVKVDYHCEGPVVDPQDPTIIQHEDYCEHNGKDKRREDPDDVTKYQWLVLGRWVSMPCPTGTRFFRASCTCDHYAQWIAPPTPREITCLDFTDNFQGSRSVYVKVKGVTKTTDGDAAWFNGFSYLNIPFFNNNDRRYSISLSYSRDPEVEEEDQTLVLNTDCKLRASFRLLLKTPELLEARVITDDAAQEASVSAKVARDGWHHVVMVFQGGRVILYVDGVKHVSTDRISGSVKVQQCPLWLGGGDSVGFSGAMDEICIFRSMTDTQAMKLYNERPHQKQWPQQLS